MSLYSLFFKTVLQRMDPETAHNLAFKFIKLAGKLPTRLVGPDRAHRSLRVQAMGITFPSPFGLAAGFDKNAEGIIGLGNLGFGHVEVGTLTAQPQPGNPKPRLFRLVEDRALINRMGFNNKGSAAAVGRLKRAHQIKGRPIIGVNIGKSKITPVEDAIADYVQSAERVAKYADYLAVNVSSPNTPGLRGLQELDQLGPLLKAVKTQAGSVPVLVKIAPDMDDEQIVGIVELAKSLELAGIIATNTTIARDGLVSSRASVEEIGAGGLSGSPLKSRSVEVLRVIKKHADTDLAIISVGGVETATDVYERIKAGATLVQGYSALIYEGPLWARKINKRLKKLLTA